MIKTNELRPNTAQKSFYGKASWFELNNRVYLVSYDTIVACFDRSSVKMLRCIDSDLYTNTTAKHIRAFFDLFYCHTPNKKEFLKFDYLDVSDLYGKFERNKFTTNL